MGVGDGVGEIISVVAELVGGVAETATEVVQAFSQRQNKIKIGGNVLCIFMRRLNFSSSKCTSPDTPGYAGANSLRYAVLRSNATGEECPYG